MDTKVKVAVVVTNSEGKVLLIKERLRSKPHAFWNVMKGTYDGGETIFECAIRECNEEASVAVTLVSLLGVYISEQEDKMRVQFNFLASTNDAAQVAAEESQQMFDECIEEVRWFAKDEITLLVPEDFVSYRAYQLLQDWMSGQSFPLESVKRVSM